MSRTIHRALLTLAALAAASLPLRAQEDDDRYPMDGAGVPDDRQAAAKFDRATALFQMGRWDEGSAKLYEMVEQYGERLVLFGAAGQFVSARRLAAKVARELPPEGLAAWRRQIDSRVGAGLATASRPRDFRRILRDFPNSTREPEVRILLAKALANEGDVEGEAEALWGLVENPGDASSTAAAAAKLAIDLGALNDREGLDALEAKLGIAMSDKVRWRGKTATVRDVMKAARALLKSSGDDAPAWAAWPTFGGNGSRDRIAAGVKGVPPPTARYPFVEGPCWSTNSQFGGMGGWTARHAEALLTHPAIADGLIVVNEGNVAWAKELASDGGRPLWTIEGVKQPSMLMFDERCLHGATLAGGRAFFTLATSTEKEQVKMRWLVAVYPVPHRKLFCVEAQSGKRIWETGGEVVKGKEFAARASYHGAPVVDGDRLYCAATFWATQVDPTEHWVVCLDANTGREIWRTFVASGIPEINLFGNTTRESIPNPLTVSGDRILICTNLGVVACLDRTDGGLLWARRYPRFRVEPIKDAYDTPRNPVTWLQSPICMAKDPSDGKRKVVVAPMDGPFLLCLSAEDGELIWRIPRPELVRESDPDYRYIVGVRDGVIYLSGDSVMAIELKSAKRLWSDRLELPSPPSGRGLLASDGLYVPLRTGLLRLGFKDPSAGRQFWPWPVSGMAGHLLFVDQAVVTAGNALLTVCYDPLKARAFLEAEIAKNPGSAYLRYRLAICLQSIGDADRAEQTLKHALELAEKRGDDASRVVAESCRRTLFRNRLTSAAAMLRKSDGARRAAEEYEKARPYATTEGEWLELLFAAAQARRAAGDLAGAVTVLQEVIAKHGDQAREGDTARVEARRAIDAILAAGREPYAAAEQEAAALLARARKDNDPALFEDLLNRFPNSLAAEDASYGAGHARFAASDWAGACEAFQKFLHGHPQSRQLPQAMAELAVAFEKRGMWGMSGAQLRRIKKSAGEAQIRMEGGAVSAAKWAEARLAGAAYKRAEGEGAVPEVGFPAEKVWTWAGQRGWDLKVLDPDGAGGWKNEPILAVSGAMLVALEPGKGTERWRSACPNGASWGAWSAGLVVVAGPEAAEAFHEDGSSAWRTQLGGATMYEGHEAEGAVFLAIRTAVTTSSFVVAIDAATGQISWRQDMQPGHVVQHLWVTDEGVAWLSRAEDAVIVADRESGALRARWPLGASRIVQAGPDRFLALTWENELTLLEASTGRTLWSAPQPGMRLESALTIASGVALTTMTADSGQQFRIYDLESGKLRHEIELGTVWVKQILADASTVYVAYKKADGSSEYVTAAFELSSGKELWRTPVPGVQSMYPGRLAKGHILLNCPVTRRPPGGGAVLWVPTIVAIDKKTGLESGRIEGRPAQTPTYTFSIAPGRVVIAEGDTVEAWGR